MATGSTNMSIFFKDRNLIKTMIDNSDYTKDLIIPSDVTVISDDAFYRKTGFKGRLILPNGLTYIGVTNNQNNAFYGCSGFIGDLTIPDTVISIPYGASGIGTFRGCSGFNGTLTIGTGLTTLAGTSVSGYQFYGCSGFTRLVLPNTLGQIGGHCFDGCTGLTDIDCYRTTPPSIQSSSFTSVTARFYVPANNIYAYKTATNWTTKATQICGRKDYIIDDTFEDFAQGVYTTTTWYASKADLVAGTNPIASGTTVGASGTYFCTLT